MFDEDIDDDEQFFAAEMAKKMHKEQMSALKGIATFLNKPEKDDKAIIEAINKQGDKIEKVATAIANQPKPEKPEVNVEVSNKEILPLLKEIKEGQEELKKAFENRPMVDEFKISSKGYSNYDVKVTYKPANQVTIKK